MKKFISVVIALAMTVLCVMPTLCVNAAAKDFQVTLECEDADEVVSCDVYDSAAASGGKAVKGVRSDEVAMGYLKFFHIEVPEDGEYDVDIYYASEKPLTFRIAGPVEVNGPIWCSTSETVQGPVSTGNDDKFEKITVSLEFFEDPSYGNGNEIVIYSLYGDPFKTLTETEPDETMYAPVFDKIVIRAKGVPSDEEGNKGETAGDKNDEPTPTPEETTVATEEPTIAPTTAPATTAPATTQPANTDADNAQNNGGSSTGLIIGIVAAVVVIAAVAAFFVVKKKKK